MKFFFALLASCALLCGTADAADLKAGAATSNITPAIGADPKIRTNRPPATHVHDELHARCLVLDDGQAKLALVVCDLLGIHRVVSYEARKLIQQQSGIPPECVMISVGAESSSVISTV